MALSTETSHDIEMAVSELVANAVLHGGPPYSVDLDRTTGTVHAEVMDASQRCPVLNPCPSDTGFGLRIVDATTSRWGFGQTDTGKTVWFEIDLPALQIKLDPAHDN